MTEPAATASIRTIDAAGAQARLGELAAILVDAVAHGASVNFMAGLSNEAARAFWRSQLPGIASGEKRLFAGDDGNRLVATVLLTFAHQPNAPHRAEIGKMLVHSSARRQGIGRRLLTAAENAARDAGRTLLLLDTETGSVGERLYRSCGWTEVGRIPGHSFRPDGSLADASMFFKDLAPHRRPVAVTRHRHDG
jgi:GNAT superfamily N-acetyltransferase